MDTDGGDHPCTDLTCHLMPAYLHGTRRGRRAFFAPLGVPFAPGNTPKDDRIRSI